MGEPLRIPPDEAELRLREFMGEADDDSPVPDKDETAAFTMNAGNGYDPDANAIHGEGAHNGQSTDTVRPEVELLPSREETGEARDLTPKTPTQTSTRLAPVSARLPCDPAAEAATLGKLLINPVALPEVLAVFPSVPSDDLFTERFHQVVWSGMMRCHDEGRPIDPIHVQGALTEDEALDATLSEICALMDIQGTSAGAVTYARRVSEVRRQRAMIVLTEKYCEAVRKRDPEASSLLQQMNDLHADEAVEIQPADVLRMVTEEPPETRYVFQIVMPAGALCGVDAQGGLGKSWLVLQQAISLATGRVLLDLFRPVRPRRALYLSSEDPEDVLWQRTSKIARAFDFTDEERALLAENLVLYPATRLPLAAIDHRGVCVPTQEYRYLERLVQKHQPGCLYLDPVAHFLGGTEENDNVQRAAFMNSLSDLMKHVDEGMAVFLSGHVSKQREDTLDSAAGRGAAAHRDAMRSLFGMTPLSQKEAKDLGVTDPTLFTKLANTKANWAPRTGGVIYLKRMTDECGGVLQQVDLEAQREEIADVVRERVARRLTELLADNPEELTVREVVRTAKGKDLRDMLKDEFKAGGATCRELEVAIGYAEQTGLITIEEQRKGRAVRRIPRQAERGKNRG